MTATLWNESPNANLVGQVLWAREALHDISKARRCTAAKYTGRSRQELRPFTREPRVVYEVVVTLGEPGVEQAELDDVRSGI